MRRRTYTDSELRKKEKGLCIAFRCMNKPGVRQVLCYKHLSRERKEIDPVQYLWNIKKQRAKERGIYWDWPLNEFREFVERTGYLDKKGRYAANKTIDRINPNIGYQGDNVQILTHFQNSRKGNREDFVMEIEDLPF